MAFQNCNVHATQPLFVVCNYQPGPDHLNVSLDSNRLKDAWDQYYFGTGAKYPLNNDLSLFGDLNSPLHSLADCLPLLTG